MTTTKLAIALILLVSYSCGQNGEKHTPDKKATELHSQAMDFVQYINNPDSAPKAISLLDEATEIDESCVLCHQSKLMFYIARKEYDKAILTNNKILELRPLAHDVYLSNGMLYDITGDTVSSREYLNKSLAICTNILDTLNEDDAGYFTLATNKAITLIMLNDSAGANQLLTELYTKQPETNEAEKEHIQMLMNKNKEQLLNPSKMNEGQ